MRDGLQSVLFISCDKCRNCWKKSYNLFLQGIKLAGFTQSLPAAEPLKIRIFCTFTDHERINKGIVRQTKTELSPQKSVTAFLLPVLMTQGMGP